MRQGKRIRVGDVAGWEWESETTDSPMLVFAHATGFNASAYKSLLGLLSPEIRVVAFDQRGHGNTSLPADPSRLRSWEVYAQDLVKLLEKMTTRPVHFAGHSMGSIAGAMAAAVEPALFRSLTLFDPVLVRPAFYHLMRSPLGGLLRGRMSLAGNAARRRSQWAGRASVVQSYRGRGVFADLPHVVLMDYLEDGLVEGNNGVRLACKPAWEAATFRSQQHRIWRHLDALPSMPVAVIIAEHQSTFRVPPSKLLASVPEATFHIMQGCGHFAPLQQPEVARDYLENTLLGS